MNHMQILKNAWKIMWSYRALWIFGMIIALTSPSSLGNNRGNQVSYQFGPGEFPKNVPAEVQRAFQELSRLFNENISSVSFNTIIAIVVGLICFALLLIVIFRIGYYVSQTALVRMVNDHEETGEKAPWRQGFRYGWSRTSWRLFLIDLVIYVPVVVILAVLIGCASLPVFASAIGTSHQPTAPGIVATVGMIFVLIFVVILVVAVLSLVMNLIRRECVLKGTGVIDSIRQGWEMLRSRFVDVFVLWLILLGIHIGYIIVLIPVILLLLGVGALVGGGVGFLVYFLTNLVAAGAPAMGAGLGLGIGFFLLVLALPLLFLGGLRETYFSTAWTLAYREISQARAKQLDVPAPAEGPAPESTGA